MTPAGGATPGVDYAALFRTLPTPYMVMDRDLVIVEANEAYLASVGRSRGEIVGRYVFDAFPPTPDALDGTGVSRVQRSFERARDTGLPDTMPVQKYDIHDPAAGGLVERFWSLISMPVLDGDGRTVLVAQRADDITDFVAERRRGQAERERGERWRRRAEEVEADLFARSQELERALRDREVAAGRLARLAEVAGLLTAAETVDNLERIVVGRGLPVLGADGGAVVTPHPDGGWRVSVDAALPWSAAYSRLDADNPLPGCVTARTGRRLVLPTRAAGLAFDGLMAQVYEDTGLTAWVVVPLRVGDAVLGSLAVAWAAEHPVSADELEVVEAFAAQLAQTLGRIRAAEAERAAAADARRLSETLQRSMLTRPPASADLDVAVRYQPAAQEAQVGGDWYDAFVTAAGTTMIVVGDVSGHDRTAAALMGQVRNLLRGMAYDSADTPAALLARLDAAMAGLHLDTLATAVLGRLEPVTPDGAAGEEGPGGEGSAAVRLRWSNAGHLPPLLRTPDGAVRLLGGDGDGDLLLGLEPAAGRADRVVDLPAGSAVVLYTDGLVERRDAGIDDGVARLAGLVARAGGGAAKELADAVLEEMGPQARDDDVALLVLVVRGTG